MMCALVTGVQTCALPIFLSGEIEEISDVSQVVIEPIPPEEFIKTGRSRYLDKADYLAHRYRCTLGDLVDDGYEPALVYSITGSDDDLAMDAEKLQCEEDTTSGFLREADNIDEEGRTVTVYEGSISIESGRTSCLERAGQSVQVTACVVAL